MKSESLDARNTAESAISSGVPNLFIGMLASRNFFVFGFSISSLVRFVATIPGEIVFTFILCGLSSCVSTFVRFTIAPFAAEYAEVFISPAFPAIDATFIIFPFLFCFMCSATFFMNRNAPLRFTSSICVHSFSFVSCTGLCRNIPALFTSMSIF